MAVAVACGVGTGRHVKKLSKYFHAREPYRCHLKLDRRDLLHPAGPAPSLIHTEALGNRSYVKGDMAFNARVALFWASIAACAVGMAEAATDGGEPCPIAIPWHVRHASLPR